MFDKILAAISLLALAGCSVAHSASETGDVPTIAADQQAFLDTCEPWDEWDKPAPPFKLHAHTYYVGTCGIAAILIDNNGSYLLIDTGTQKGAEIVLANIRRLDIEPEQIKTIAMSHEHFDHVGGIALVKEQTGAVIVSSYAAKETLATGLPSAGDPQQNSGHTPFTPPQGPIVTLIPDAIANVGLRKVTPIVTPGHTPGALSWQWQDCEGEKCDWIVYADSLSPISSDDYRLSAHPAYVAEYRAGLQRLREAKCDMLITPHPSSSQMIKRMKAGGLRGGLSCVDYADSIEQRLDKRLAQENATDQ